MRLYSSNADGRSVDDDTVNAVRRTKTMPTMRDRAREQDNTRREKVGAAADAAAESEINEGDLGAAAGAKAKDPFAPELSDFPNPGGLGGAAQQNAAYKKALEMYNSDPVFRNDFATKKKSMVAGAVSDAAAMDDMKTAKRNRAGMSAMPPDEKDKKY